MVCRGALAVLGCAGALYAISVAPVARAENASAPPDHPPDPREVARLRAEAEGTLARGQFDRARREFEEVLRQMPGDPQAQRNAARAAQAAGEFEYAAAALERAHHFEEHRKDPELHYLRGEALYVLKRSQEAAREHRIAELEIGHPLERMPKLWLARIWARRGWIDRADQLYESMWPAAPKVDTEVSLNQTDAHLMNEDWLGAIAVLDRYLALQPKDVRGREMLAWALEATQNLERELVVRASLAADAPTMSHHWEYGRALERAADYSGAYKEYSSAQAAAKGQIDPELALSVNRMHYRVTPEVGGGTLFRTDPAAKSVRLYAGLAVPFGTRHAVSGMTWYEYAWGGYPKAGASTGGLGATVVLGARYGGTMTLGGTLRFTGSAPDGTPPPWAPGVKVRTVQAGAFVNLQSPILNFAQIDAQGDLNSQWAESPVALQQGGTASGLTAHLYMFLPSRRVMIDSGTQIRRLTLAAPEGAGSSPSATQELLFVGGDVVLWSEPRRVLKGDIMDETLVHRTYLADSAVLSYRHYELFTSSDPEFNARLFLAPRAQINNGALIVRKAFLDGRFAVEARGGFGYDTHRDLYLYQAGGSLLLASWTGRLSLSYDFNRETTTGFKGNRQIGWLSYHAEF